MNKFWLTLLIMCLVGSALAWGHSTLIRQHAILPLKNDLAQERESFSWLRKSYEISLANAQEENARLRTQLEQAYSNQGLRDFKSMQELMGFLSGVTVNTNEYKVPDYDCEDFSLELQRLAAKQGFRLHLMTIADWYSLHMLNFAVIPYWWDDEWVQVGVAIEPQTLEVILIARMDSDVWIDEMQKQVLQGLWEVK